MIASAAIEKRSLLVSMEVDYNTPLGICKLTVETMADSRKSREVRQKALLARLSRVEGQIRAVRRMIDEGEPCEAIAQQLAASKTAMNKAFCEMMACAIEHEIVEECSLDEAGQDTVARLTEMLTRYG